MSDQRRFSTDFEGERRRARVAAWLFGDRIGLAVFLATICLFTVLWIVAWRINDSLTLLNTLDGMSKGKLHIVEVQYGSTLRPPGTHQLGDRVFGRNYGILAASLVPMLLLEGLATVADLRVAIAGAFSLLVLATAVVSGRILQRRRLANRLGAIAAVALFVGNLAVATDLDPARTELYAIQLTHMVVAAVAVLFAYRLLAAVHGRRAGLFAAALVALATPVGLWATIPKRHVVAAAVALAIGYALYRSRVRDAETPGSGLTYRAGAYATIALFAWVHAPEALLILVVFAAVDLPTGRRDLRTLTTIAAATAVATVPFLVTNYLLSGSPFKPPRMLPEVGGSTGEPSFSGGGGGGGGLLAPIDPLLRPMLTLADLFRESLVNLVAKPGDVWATFVRSGYLEQSAARADYESVNLAILESAPILAATLGVVPVAIRRFRDRAGTLASWPPSPERTLDAYLGLFTVAFALLYLARLPIHAQITVRYMLPIFPTLVVLLVRLPAIRGVLDDHWQLVCWTYAIAVLIGGQLVVVAMAMVDPGVGEAFQFHALLGLVIAVPLAGWSLAGRSDGWWGRTGAVLLALATAAITVFLLLLTLDYFTVGNSQALPLVRAIAEIVSLT